MQKKKKRKKAAEKKKEILQKIRERPALEKAGWLLGEGGLEATPFRSVLYCPAEYPQL